MRRDDSISRLEAKVWTLLQGIARPITNNEIADGFRPGTTVFTRTWDVPAVCIASCYLPDYYSSAPKAEGPQGRIPRASQHRRLLNSLGGKILHVFPLDLDQVPTLFNPLGLALTLRAEHDCCLLA